jgi:hypothetical protein
MTLAFPTGEPFTLGVMGYEYRSATSQETTPRLVLEVAIDGILVESVVDTGGVYLFCNPYIAHRLALAPAAALSGAQTVLFRGVLVHGRLYRLSLTLLADEGEDLTIQTTAFVPEPDEAEGWGDMPCILGLYGCLERLRFAVDSHTEQFYFGPAVDA